MANKSYKDVGIRMKNTTSNSTGWVTLTGYVNQHSLKRAIKLMDDTAYSDTNDRWIPGMPGTTFTLNGWVNSTTDNLFGYFVANSTSLARSFEMKEATGKYYNGNVFVSDVTFSGKVKDMQTFSASLSFDGAVNKTSVALVS